MNSRHIITRARDDTSSLIWAQNTERGIARQSTLTENSTMLDAMFDFDNEIFNSKAYQRAMRSNIRYGLNRRRKEEKSFEEPPPSMTTSSTISTPLERNERETHIAGIESTSLRILEGGARPSYNIGNSSLEATFHPSIRTVQLRPVDTLLKKHSWKDGLIRKIPTMYGQRLIRGTSNLLASRKSQNPPSTSRKGAQAARSKGIDKSIKRDRMAKGKEVKLLFLGAAGGGKSTVLNQMRLLCQRDYTAFERESYKPVVFSNMIKLMRDIVEAMNKLDFCLDDKKGEHYIQDILVQPLDPKWNILPSKVADAFNFLWMDAGVQRYYQRPNGHHTGSSAKL